jgi:hypothetical protein
MEIMPSSCYENKRRGGSAVLPNVFTYSKTDMSVIENMYEPKSLPNLQHPENTNRFNRIKILIMYQISRQLLTGHYMIQNTHYKIGLIKLYITISRFEKLIK